MSKTFTGRAAAVASLCWLSVAAEAIAGPYSHGLNDPGNVNDAPVPGFVGVDGIGRARLPDGSGGYVNPDNAVNPLFLGWAANANYQPANPGAIYADFSDPTRALGPVTGDNFDVVSLGELTADDLATGAVPGQITLTFDKPIVNKPGADFAVFENGVISGYSTGGAGPGGVFAELAYVEVSSDGVHFARFPCVSQTASSAGAYGTTDPTKVYNLAGKHVNAGGDSWGTPFDLGQLANDPLVASGMLNLNAVTCVRLVDIPGSGAYADSGGNPIFDPWPTSGSGGFDLEAVGVISQETSFAEWEDQQGLTGTQRGPAADPDGDRIPNLLEYAFSLSPLTPDAAGLPSAAPMADRVGISFSRDTRKVDLTYEVQASADLAAWMTIARSVAGGALSGVAPNAPAITDASDSAIASVGVIRRETVADVVSRAQAPRRFLRVRVSLAP